jgi:intein-encoded DNA endonuclease-like protein
VGKRNKVLTEKQKEEVVLLYKEGRSTTEIAKIFGVWSNAINGLLKRRNIKLRSASEAHKKYYINETFFDNIDSEEKAYTLGMFYADGSNNINRYKAYIMLAEEDVDILEKIRNLVSPEKPLLYQKRKDGNPKHQNRYMFYIDNKHISIQLEKLGCVTNKTYILKFPEWLDKKLYKHFIRGYFDGDGHVGLYGKQIQISIVGTENFCMSLQSTLSIKNIDSRIYCRFPERENSI